MKSITSLLNFRFSFLIPVLCIISDTVFSQIPKEAFDLTNSLSELWYKGETEKAVENSLRLYKLYPAFLVDRIHNSLSQTIINKDRRKYGVDYLDELMKKENSGINELITPIYYWSKVYQTDNENDIKDIISVLTASFSDSSYYKSRPERYCLLTLNALNQKNGIEVKIQKELLKAVMIKLETYPFLDSALTTRKESEERAWNRYLLAYSNYYLFSNFDKKEEIIQKASEYSPDKNDRLAKYAYSYDAFLLTGNPATYSFQKEYFNYLNDEGNRNKALNLITEITFNDPSDDNLARLKSYYSEHTAEKSFDTYWSEFINSQCEKTPDVSVKFPGEKLDLKKKPGRWIYIDVWGTWCGPCKKELPELQTFYTENLENKDSKLEIYTFSFASKNLNEFMKNNNYTFPVSEVGEDVTHLFHVTGYPTKILITPEGNYLKIPFNSDWKTYVKNYSQM